MIDGEGPTLVRCFASDGAESPRDVQVLEFQNSTRIRREPKQGISRVWPWEDPLAICQLQRIRMQITADSNDAFGGCVCWIWEAKNRHTQSARLPRVHADSCAEEGGHRCLLQTVARDRDARFVVTVFRSGRVLWVRPAVLAGAWSETRPLGRSMAMVLSICVNSSEHSCVRTIR